MSASWDLGSGIWDLGFGIGDMGTGIWDLGCNGAKEGDQFDVLDSDRAFGQWRYA